MESFDITSLYTNIPIIDTLNIIKDYVNNDDQFNKKAAITQDKILDLVHLVLTTTWCTFNSQLYQQTDGITMAGPASSTTAEIYQQTHGIAMGGPASSTTAEIYMQSYECTAILRHCTLQNNYSTALTTKQVARKVLFNTAYSIIINKDDLYKENARIKQVLKENRYQNCMLTADNCMLKVLVKNYSVYSDLIK